MLESTIFKNRKNKQMQGIANCFPLLKIKREKKKKVVFFWNIFFFVTIDKYFLHDK